MRVDPAFQHDMFRFLVKSLRDKDAAGVLERYLLGPQGAWEDLTRKIGDLDTLHDVDAISDDLLIYLKHHVGWTPENDAITENLSAANLRKLIGLSLSFWKTRGTELGIKDAIRLLVGRDVVIWNWFATRWTVDVSGFQRLGIESDSFATGGFGGDRGEYTSVIWVMEEPGVSIDRQLLRDLVDLHRPLQEVYLVAYAKLVDDFRLGRSKWKPIPADATGSSWDSTLYRMDLDPGAIVSANVNGIQTWKDVVWRNQVRFGAISDIFRIVVNAQNNEDRYEVNFSQDGSLQIVQYVGGVATTIGTSSLPHAFPVGEPQIVGVNALRPATGQLRLSVIVYEVEELIVTIADPASVFASGRWRLQNAGAGEALSVDNVIAFTVPLHVDVIEGPGTVAAVPSSPALSPAVIVVDEMNALGSWTLSGLWHSTTFRHFSPFTSLYFGTGEIGYFSWGTPGAMGAIANLGFATSPIYNLSSWTSNKFRLFLEIKQWLDIRTGASDQPLVEVLVAGVSVLSFTKTAIVAAGTSALFEITAVAAGLSAVSFRFGLNTVTVPSPSREGWYIDDLRILAVEV